MLRVLFSWALVLPRRLRMARAWPLPVGSQAAYLLVAIAVPAILFLIGLDAFPLRDTNEGLYAEVAREMLATGHYLVPQLNGVPYIEKPPLLYWLASAAMAVWGPEPGAVRLASALPMLALCLGMFLFCRRHLSAAVGCYASVALASMVPVALLAHLVLFDALLTALLGGWMLCFLHAYLQTSARGGAVARRAAAVLLGLAVLEKGAVAPVLAFGVLALFLLLNRDRRGWRQLRDPVALALFLAVVLPWHVLAAFRQDGFAWFYVVNEHVLRFLGRRQPDDYHRGPVWFYLPRLLGLLLPWTPFLILLARRQPWGDHARRTTVRFCQAAVLFPLLFFSLSQAKADYYLVVCTPALALWLALVLEQALAHPPGLRLACCWGGAVTTCVVLLAALPGAGSRVWTPLSFALLCLAWLSLMPVATRGFFAFASLRVRECALLAIVVLALPLLDALVDRGSARAAVDSSNRIADIVRAQAGPGSQVFIYRDFEDHFSSLPFYLGRTVPVIDSASRDLLFGCTIAPGKTCIDHHQFLRRSRAGPVAVAVLARRRDAFLAMAGPGWRSEAVGDRIVFFNAAHEIRPEEPLTPPRQLMNGALMVNVAHPVTHTRRPGAGRGPY
jgi:4-amino-4-deoxy-L-arabinose transferase-like glycosyltransferase